MNFLGRPVYLPRKHSKFRAEFRGKHRRKFHKLRFKISSPFSETSFSRGAMLTKVGPCKRNMISHSGGSQKGGFQKGGFGGCSPGTKTGTRVRSPKPPFWKPPFYLPVTLFGVDKRVVSKRVVSADVPLERKPERGYIRQNHPFTKPPFYLQVTHFFFVKGTCFFENARSSLI